MKIDPKTIRVEGLRFLITKYELPVKKYGQLKTEMIKAVEEAFDKKYGPDFKFSTENEEDRTIEVVSSAPKSGAAVGYYEPILMFDDKRGVKVYDYSEKSYLILIPRERGIEQSGALRKFSTFGNGYTIGDQKYPGWILSKKNQVQLDEWLESLSGPKSSLPRSSSPRLVEFPQPSSPRSSSPAEISRPVSPYHVISSGRSMASQPGSPVAFPRSPRVGLPRQEITLPYEIVDYSEKALALFVPSETGRARSSDIKKFAVFNPNLKYRDTKRAGWIISKSKREKLDDFVKTL